MASIKGKKDKGEAGKEPSLNQQHWSSIDRSLKVTLIFVLLLQKLEALVFEVTNLDGWLP